MPVRGAILLNHNMDQVILVKGWKKSANWSFPRGKINKDEADLDCAIREVYEETGFHVRDAGLVGDDENMKYIDVTMREQQLRLYVFPGIPMDAHFAPRTRKEISKIQWYKLSELPTLKKQKQQQGQSEDLATTANKFYMVAPFMVPLKKWIQQQRKAAKPRKHNKTLALSDRKTSSGITVDKQPTINGSSKPLGTNEGGITSAHLGHAIPKPKEPISDLPEVSERSASINDPAAELKSILKVPLRDNSESLKPAINKASTLLKSSALLTLLKAGSGPESEKPPPPLLEQMIGSAKMPAAPNYHHQRLGPSQGLRQSPTHLNPNELEKGINATIQNPEPSNRGPHQQIMIPNHGPLCKNPQPSIDNMPEPPLGPKNVPPYQITGDPQFAQNPHIPSMGTSSIPQASKIPPPKLTTQSSLLLSLFKNQQLPAFVASTTSEKGQATSPGLELVAAEGIHSIASTSTLCYNASLDNPKASAETPLMKKLAEHTPLKAVPVKGPGIFREDHNSRPVQVEESIPTPRMPQTAERSIKSNALSSKTKAVGANDSAIATSQHKKSLLRLFRKPSFSKAEGAATVSSNTLELPSTLAELSASPSPGHSREPSQIKTRPLDNGLNLPDITSNLTLLHKQPLSDPKPKWAPVFATVNGPLNVPTFEVLSRTSKESRVTSNTNNNAHVIDRSPPIVASPSASNRGPSPKPGQGLLKTSVGPARMSSVQSHGKTKAVDLNPLTPQTLIPPLEASASSQNSAAPLGTHPVSLSRPSPTDEPQGQSSHDHKEILLSLLNKTSYAAEPKKTFTGPPIINPFTERFKSDPASSHAVSPLTARSRISSITSAIGERGAPVGGENSLPRTTPGYKSFLLGYLNGVAKNE